MVVKNLPNKLWYCTSPQFTKFSNLCGGYVVHSFFILAPTRSKARSVLSREKKCKFTSVRATVVRRAASVKSEYKYSAPQIVDELYETF